MSGKGVRLTSDEEEALRNVDPGSDVATSIVETAKLRESSKERNTENAIYNVLAEIEEDELENTKTKVLNDLLSKTAMSEEEKRSFIAKFFEQAAEAKEKMDSTREYNQAVLAAKIAARRRMKESLAKEKAMKDEVSALSKKQVNIAMKSNNVLNLNTSPVECVAYMNDSLNIDALYCSQIWGSKTDTIIVFVLQNYILLPNRISLNYMYSRDYTHYSTILMIDILRGMRQNFAMENCFTCRLWMNWNFLFTAQLNEEL